MELGECKDARIFGSISVATAAACLLHYLLPTYIHPQYKNAAAGRRLIVFTFIGRWRTTQIARRRRSRKRKNASRWCYGQLRIPLYSYVGYTTSRLTVRDKRWIKRLCMWNKPSFGWDLLNFLYIHIFIPGFLQNVSSADVSPIYCNVPVSTLMWCLQLGGGPKHRHRQSTIMNSTQCNKPLTLCDGSTEYPLVPI